MEQAEPSKKYEVLGFSRETLTLLGLTQQQLHRLNDEDMSRIAASIAKTYPDFEERVRINVGLYLISLDNRRSE